MSSMLARHKDEQKEEEEVKAEDGEASFGHGEGARALLELCAELDAAGAFQSARQRTRPKAEQRMPATPPEQPLRKPNMQPRPKTAQRAPMLPSVYKQSLEDAGMYSYKDELEEAGIKREVEEMEAMREVSGEHPWAVRKKQRGRATDLSGEELRRLRSEQAAAATANLPWEERGPSQDYSEYVTGASGSSSSSAGPSVPFWRGNPWREGAYGGKKRFAKRGGQHQEYYARLNRAGMLKPTSSGAVRVDKPW